MNKKISTSKKDDSEEPLIDQSSEGLKKLILKGKKKGFLHRTECEKALENEKFDDKEEFYSKVESLNIQIYDEDSEETSNDENEAGIVATEKDEDSGRTDDPVRMYLKEMGNVELLSRVGEIAIAKRIEEGKKKTADAFSKSIISMMSIQKYFEDYEVGERQIRDFIDLDTTFRSVNGEQEEFDADISIKDEQIFNNNNEDDDQGDEEEKTNEEDQEDFDSEASDDNNELSDLSILEKEENLKPHITSNLEKFSKLFKKYKKLKEEYINLRILNKKIDIKLEKKIKSAEKSVSEQVMNIFINQNRIDDVIETHRMYNIQIVAGERKLSDIASKLKISNDEFDKEYNKNGQYKNWLRNLTKKNNKKWVSFAKKEN